MASDVDIEIWEVDAKNPVPITQVLGSYELHMSYICNLLESIWRRWLLPRTKGYIWYR